MIIYHDHDKGEPLYGFIPVNKEFSCY